MTAPDHFATYFTFLLAQRRSSTHALVALTFAYDIAPLHATS